MSAARREPFHIKWQSEEGKKPNSIGRVEIDFLFLVYFMKTILSIGLTIPPHKEFILRWWLLIKTILTPKLKCKICFFVSVCLFFFSFLMRGPRSANLQLVQTSFFYWLHCYFFHIAPRWPLPSQISHPWHGRRGTVNVKYFGYQKKKIYSGSVLFLLRSFLEAL